MKRRVLLVEVDMPDGLWSAHEWEAFLSGKLPLLRPVVFGSVSGSEVDAAFRKLRQLSRAPRLGRRRSLATSSSCFVRKTGP